VTIFWAKWEIGIIVKLELADDQFRMSAVNVNSTPKLSRSFLWLQHGHAEYFWAIDRGIGIFISNKVNVVQKIVRLLFCQDVGEVVQPKEIKGRVSDETLRILASIPHRETAIGFLAYGKHKAERLDSTRSVDRFVLAPLQGPIPSRDN
jgi:hypothetical protein